MRVIFVLEKGDRKVRVVHNNEYNEYIVKLYINGIRVPDADYFTDDRGDAMDTAKEMVKAP